MRPVAIVLLAPVLSFLLRVGQQQKLGYIQALVTEAAVIQFTIHSVKQLQREAVSNINEQKPALLIRAPAQLVAGFPLAYAHDER